MSRGGRTRLHGSQRFTPLTKCCHHAFLPYLSTLLFSRGWLADAQWKPYTTEKQAGTVCVAYLDTWPLTRLLVVCQEFSIKWGVQRTYEVRIATHAFWSFHPACRMHGPMMIEHACSSCLQGPEAPSTGLKTKKQRGSNGEAGQVIRAKRYFIILETPTLFFDFVSSTSSFPHPGLRITPLKARLSIADRLWH
jgi:hypothetical protein